MEAESLLPKLPDPKDLQPFPTAVSLSYEGHKDAVTCLSVDPTGQWLATGSDDKSVRVWEITTGRCMKVRAGVRLSGRQPRDVALLASPHPSPASGSGSPGGALPWRHQLCQVVSQRGRLCVGGGGRLSVRASWLLSAGAGAARPLHFFWLTVPRCSFPPGPVSILIINPEVASNALIANSENFFKGPAVPPRECAAPCGTSLPRALRPAPCRVPRPARSPHPKADAAALFTV